MNTNNRHVSRFHRVYIFVMQKVYKQVNKCTNKILSGPGKCSEGGVAGVTDGSVDGGGRWVGWPGKRTLRRCHFHRVLRMEGSQLSKEQEEPDSKQREEQG